MKPVPIFDAPIRLRDWPAVAVYFIFYSILFGIDDGLKMFRKKEKK